MRFVKVANDTEEPMTAQEVLEKVANGMVASGRYKDVATAIRALALEQVEAKIAAYREKVHEFEKKYGHTVEEHSPSLLGKASMEDDEEWMEWKGAAVMLQAWQQALREML